MPDLEHFRKTVNDAVAASRHLQGEITRLTKPTDDGGEGLAADDPRVLELGTQLDTALDAADAAKESLAQAESQERVTTGRAERLEALERFRADPDTPPPPTSDGPSEPVRETQRQLVPVNAGYYAQEVARNVRYAERMASMLPSHLTCHGYGDALTALARAGGREYRLEADAQALLVEGRIENYVLQTAVDELGGHTVPIDFIPDVVREIAQRAVVRPLASIRPTTSNFVSMTTVQQPTVAGDRGIYTSAFKGGWASETPAATDQEVEPLFGRIGVPVRRTRSICWLSEDEVADAAFDVLDLLRDDGALNLALVEDLGFLDGTGVDGEPRGILRHADIQTTDISDSSTGAVANTIGGATPAEAGASHVKLLDLQYAVPVQYRSSPGVAFVMHSQSEKKIRQLRDADGNFIWVSGFADRPNTLLGDPVRNTDQMDQDGTDGNQVIIYGDFRQYQIFDRMALSVRVLLETKGDQEQIGIRLNSRVGGDVRIARAFRIGVV
jgi:HK97 family phage major capsid protein